QGRGILLDEELPHERLARLGGGAERAVVGRHVAPAEHFLAFGADDLLEHLLAALPAALAGGQKDHADTVVAGFRQADVAPAAFAREKRVRRLQENTGAVAGVRFTAARAAVFEVQKNLQRLL